VARSRDENGTGCRHGPHQINIAERLIELGWERGCNLQTRVYEGAGHAFAQTAVQMDEVLAWLLA
jgi:hypothetical protein